MLILFLSVTSGRETREVIKEVVEDPDSWQTWDRSLARPDYLQVVGMYELIGNWDLAVFIRTRTNTPGLLVSHLRREVLIRANQRPFPPVHERGGQFGRFQAISVQRERASLDSKDRSEIHRTRFESSEEYDEQGSTRTFIVVDASPNEERDPIRMTTVLEGMRRVVSGKEVEGTVECVYIGTQRLVIELMSTQPGATDITKFNRLIEPGIAEIAVQKYTLLCYEYDEVPCGWGTLPS